MKTKVLLAATMLVLGGTVLLSIAQDSTNNNDGPPAGDMGGGPDGGGPGGPEGPGGGGPRGHHRPPNLLFQALDANHDGVIDASEITNAPAALKTLDKNGDGKITMDELRPHRPGSSSTTTDTNTPPGSEAGPGDGGPGGGGPGGGGEFHHRPPPNPIFQALDVNHDGVIDATEIANAATALKTLDKNGDGKITRDEVRPPRPPRDDNGPGGDQGGPGGPGEDGPPGGNNQGGDNGMPPQGPPPGNN